MGRNVQGLPELKLWLLNDFGRCELDSGAVVIRYLITPILIHGYQIDVGGGAAAISPVIGLKLISIVRLECSVQSLSRWRHV